ncbi:T9SS type A sorting domain-containing protein [Winogradskyella tangerina]|uniref:T9SS type A sorting domain-containing protein n=1 Tax=Winogradskyella tangerina TaxID=2023240 RepID=UPI000DBE7CE4|nr:T9SS type A sorting domain-containing protein [Winogradskyella tangerina]
MKKLIPLIILCFIGFTNAFAQGDTFATATALAIPTSGTVCPSYDGTQFTDSGMDGGCHGNDTGVDVFYTWTATTNALIWNSGAAAPGIIIRDAATGDEIVCDRTGFNASIYGWTVGQDLIIQIHDVRTGQENPTSFCLETTTVTSPTNDDCSDAITLTPGATFNDNPATSDNIAATGSGELPDPSCGNYLPNSPHNYGGDQWYSVTVPADGILTIETEGVTPTTYDDTAIAVYTGSCGSLTHVMCNDDIDPGYYITNSRLEIVNSDGLANQLIYIRVWNDFGNNLIDFRISAYSATLDLKKETITPKIKYYPNPVKDVWTLNTTDIIERISIYNIVGEKVVSYEPQRKNYQADMSELNSGVYFASVKLGDNTETFKIIKQ